MCAVTLKNTTSHHNDINCGIQGLVNSANGVFKFAMYGHRFP